MSEKIALVTGGTGFVGSNLCRRLLLDGWQVHIVAIPNDNYSLIGDISNDVTVHVNDGSTQSISRIVADSRPDVVFHLASLFLAQHQPDDIEGLVRSNILFATQLVDALAIHGIRYLINTGTSWQHYENQDYSPVCLYAATKQAFETLLQYYIEAFGLRAITLKLFDTYGPNDPRPKLFKLLRKVAQEGQPLEMSPGEQMIDLVYIDDVVEAFVVAAERLQCGHVLGHESYAVSSNENLSLRSLVEKYGRIIGKKLPITWGGRPYRDREVMTPWDRGLRLPGWEPVVTIENGIKIISTKGD